MSDESMSDHLQKSVRMPGWDGSKKSYQEFIIRFAAYATYHGFIKAIGRKQDPNLPAKEEDVDEPTFTKIVKKALQRNNAAMANYTMALPPGKLGLVHKCKTVEWPNGLAWKITEQLEAQYAPRDLTSKTELRVALAQVETLQDYLKR
jgi:hypothetical protein